MLRYLEIYIFKFSIITSKYSKSSFKNDLIPGQVWFQGLQIEIFVCGFLLFHSYNIWSIPMVIRYIYQQYPNQLHWELVEQYILASKNINNIFRTNITLLKFKRKIDIKKMSTI